MKPYERTDSDDSDTEIPDVDVDKLPLLDVGPDEHKLQYTYCLWYHKGLTYKIKSPSVNFECSQFVINTNSTLYFQFFRE